MGEKFVNQKRHAIPAIVVSLILVALTPDTAAAGDTTPPSPITDLRVSAPAKAPQLHVVLTWSAPGDVSGSSGTGPATRYDIRYSGAPIVNDAGFSAARSVTGAGTLSGSLPTPGSPGMSQTSEILGLSPNRTYFFAVKSIDAAGNVSLLSNLPSGETAKYEGYGYGATGGGDGRICRVTSLASSGAGTLRDCLFAPARSCATEPLTVVFGVAGKITLTSDIKISADDCRLTIDGSTAPSPGITIGMIPCAPGLTSCPVGDACLGGGEFLVGQDEATATDQIVLTYFRFQGNYQQGWAACNDNSSATLGLQYHFSNVVLDHMTIRNGGDAGPDLWTGSYDSHDVSISNSLIAWNSHPLLMGGSTGVGSRDDVSIHHNVIARGGQRMPKIQAKSSDIDFRNNVIFDWSSSWTGWTSGDGTHITAQLANGVWLRPSVNLVNNYWFDKSGKPRLGLFYGTTSGSDAEDGGPATCGTSDNCARCPAQGTVIGTSNIGELWVAGNVLPSANCDHWSTVAAERAVPAEARVTTDGATALVTKVLPQAGTHFRSSDEDALMSEIAVTMGCGNGTRGPGEQCDQADFAGQRCQDFGYSGGTLSCTSLCTFNTGGCISGRAPAPVSNLRRTDTHP